MVQFINVRELKIHASDVIRRTRKGDVVITVRGKPQAVIHALEENDLEMSSTAREALRRSGRVEGTGPKKTMNLRRELEKIVEELKNRYRPTEIILFGSLARGEAARDIDLIVIKDTNKPFTDRLKEVALLHHSRVGVDIFVYTPEEWERLKKRGDRFVSEEVMKKGRLLYRAA